MPSKKVDQGIRQATTTGSLIQLKSQIQTRAALADQIHMQSHPRSQAYENRLGNSKTSRTDNPTRRVCGHSHSDRETELIASLTCHIPDPAERIGRDSTNP